MSRIKPQVSRLKGGLGLERVCRQLGLPDDVAVGYVSGTYGLLFTIGAKQCTKYPTTGSTNN